MRALSRVSIVALVICFCPSLAAAQFIDNGKDDSPFMEPPPRLSRPPVVSVKPKRDAEEKERARQEAERQRVERAAAAQRAARERAIDLQYRRELQAIEREAENDRRRNAQREADWRAAQELIDQAARIHQNQRSNPPPSRPSGPLVVPHSGRCPPSFPTCHRQ